RIARLRWLGEAGTASGRGLHDQQSSRALATGSNQPNSGRTWRPLGRMQNVRGKVEYSVLGAASAGHDQCQIRRGLQRSEKFRGRWNYNADAADAGTNFHRHLLGLRWNAQSLRTAATLQSN